MNINEDLLSILLLNSLPDSLEYFRVSITTKDELSKPDVLKIKIVEEFRGEKSGQNCREKQSNNAERNESSGFSRKGDNKGNKEIK